MKSDNIIQVKSYAFAVKIVNVCRSLIELKKEFVLSKQLLKSGTAIRALVEEAIGGQSDKDFFAKMTIAYKEARETKYWILHSCFTLLCLHNKHANVSLLKYNLSNRFFRYFIIALQTLPYNYL